MVLNGRSTDPAYIYIPDGARWTSLARRLGLPHEGFPAELGALPARQRLWELAGSWVGTIGPLDVQLQLYPSDTRLEGTYFYERVGEPLLLTGTRLSFTGNGIADLTLRESPEVGEPTGALQGRLDIANGSFTGLWKAAAGGRTLPFSLRRLATYVEVEDHADLWLAVGQYPVFAGALTSGFSPLNASLAERARIFQRQEAEGLAGIERSGSVRDDFQPFSESLQLTVAYFRPGLVSLRESTHGYTGGAHELSAGSAMTYALQDGGPVRLTLTEVLRPGPKMRERLVQIARPLIHQTIPSDWEKVENLIRTDRFDSFVVTPRGLSLVIDLDWNYWGPWDIPLSRAEISGLLRPDGPLGFLIDPPLTDKGAPAAAPGAKPRDPRRRR
jgi:hypothetical protein